MTHLLTLSPTFDQLSLLCEVSLGFSFLKHPLCSAGYEAACRRKCRRVDLRSTRPSRRIGRPSTLPLPLLHYPLSIPLLLLRIIAMKSDHPQAACSSSRLLSGEKLTRGPLRCESISYRLQHLFETEGVIRSFFPVLSPFFSRIIPIISSICSSLREAS